MDHASTKLQIANRDSSALSPNQTTTSEQGSKSKSLAVAIDYKDATFAKHSNIFVKESSPTGGFL